MPAPSARASSTGTNNVEHYHSGIGLLTPADVHFSRAEQILAARQQVLEGAYRGPSRAVRPRATHPARLPQAVWINKPLDPQEAPQQISALTRLTEVDRLREQFREGRGWAQRGHRR